MHPQPSPARAAVLLTAACLTALPALASAQATTWTGGGATDDWFDAGNWSNGVPNGSSATATIAAPAPTRLGAAVTLDRLVINAGGELRPDDGASLSLNTGVSNSGLIDATDGSLAFQSGRFNNQGTIRVGPGGTVSVGAATILNVVNADAPGDVDTLNGGTYVLDGGTLDIAGADFDLGLNRADLTVGRGSTDLFDDFQSGGGSFISDAFGRNDGTLRLVDGASLTTSVPNNARFENFGDLFVGAGSTFAVVAGGRGNLGVNDNGTLRGTGRVLADVGNRGTIAPGETPGAAGTLTIEGVLRLATPSTYAVDLISDTEHDRLVMVSDSEFRGTFDIDLADGFAPADGQEFQIVEFDGTLFVDSTPTVIDNSAFYDFEVFADAGRDGIFARAVLVPEPAALTLLAVPALALRRRRVG